MYIFVNQKGLFTLEQSRLLEGCKLLGLEFNFMQHFPVLMQIVPRKLFL